MLYSKSNEKLSLKFFKEEETVPALDSGKIAALHVADGWGVGEGAGVGVGRLCCHSSEAMRASASAMTEELGRCRRWTDRTWDQVQRWRGRRRRWS